MCDGPRLFAILVQTSVRLISNNCVAGAVVVGACRDALELAVEERLDPVEQPRGRAWLRQTQHRQSLDQTMNASLKGWRRRRLNRIRRLLSAVEKPQLRHLSPRV